ncbi:hypothetical protein ACFWFQ_08900, partial [Nocardia salmonicida]|uniref:hypothetical protein n=1 Tax=Nocardia salmonicida TaxID=53431 RepID=UPI003647387E
MSESLPVHFYGDLEHGLRGRNLGSDSEMPPQPAALMVTSMGKEIPGSTTAGIEISGLSKTFKVGRNTVDA